MGQVPLDVTNIMLSVSLRYLKRANKNISMDNVQNINSLPAGDTNNHCKELGHTCR